MKAYEQTISVCPRELREILQHVPSSVKQGVQDIRLRTDQPITVSFKGELRYVARNGTLTECAMNGISCPNEWIQQTVAIACEHSVYSRQEQLKHGYIRTSHGHRIGVAGTVVVQNGEIISIREIRSLCLRVSRSHFHCADTLVDVLTQNGCLHNVLICGEPSSGKTSLLKDIIRTLSLRNIAVTVIDERGELSADEEGNNADYLKNVPKIAGMAMATRSLSPQLLVVDELGGEDEIRAVIQAAHRGVATVASIHAAQEQDVLCRRYLTQAMRDGAFEYVAFLKGRREAGNVRTIFSTKEWLREDGRNRPCDINRGEYRISSAATITRASETLGGVLGIDGTVIRENTTYIRSG